VIVNGVLPQRFSGPELERLGAPSDAAVNGASSARGDGARAGRRASTVTVRRSALVAAHAVSDRARFQHNQLARLRRRKFEVISVPFQFAAKLDLTAIGGIAEHLRRKL
jgi:hypothetical protein